MDTSVHSYMTLGISPTMLIPASFSNSKEHLRAVEMGCDLTEFTALDLYLTEDDFVAQEECALLRASGKKINYNSPVQLQMFGAYDAGSERESERLGALDLMKKHLDYAAELNSTLFVATSCPDVPDRRNSVIHYYEEFMYKVCHYAKERNIQIVIEPIERHRFKKLLLGPTRETVSFVQKMQENGCENLSIMIDFGHLPLMEESVEHAVETSLLVGLRHVHFGDAILVPDHVLYGHMHPAMCERQSCYSIQDIAQQFAVLFQYGYFNCSPYSEEKPTVSIEVRPYIGVSAKTSAAVHFERLQTAMNMALKNVPAPCT